MMSKAPAGSLALQPTIDRDGFDLAYDKMREDRMRGIEENVALNPRDRP